MAADIVLFVFLFSSVYTDLRFRKILNAAVMTVLLLGVGINCAYFGWAGLASSFMGCFAGFLFLFPFYMLGAMGAGDVKFMMAVGSLKGAGFVLFGGLYGAVIGGIAAIAVLAGQKRLVKTLKDIFLSLYVLVTARTPESLKPGPGQKTYLPYTLFLSLGMALYRLI